MTKQNISMSVRYKRIAIINMDYLNTHRNIAIAWKFMDNRSEGGRIACIFLVHFIMWHSLTFSVAIKEISSVCNANTDYRIIGKRKPLVNSSYRIFIASQFESSESSRARELTNHVFPTDNSDISEEACFHSFTNINKKAWQKSLVFCIFSISIIAGTKYKNNSS